MKIEVLPLFCSPCCSDDLQIFVPSDSGENNENIENGILQCRRCEHQYPIIDGIPRLVLHLDRYEEDKLRDFLNGVIGKDNKPEPLDKEERYRQIEAIVTRKILNGYSHVWNGDPPHKSRHMKNEIEYRARYCEHQQKTVNTITKHCQSKFNTILDIGGGQGGLIKCLYDSFKPQHAFLVDYDLEWVEVARLRCPDVQIIRADGAKLPFKDRSIDLVVTQSALEHIKEYRRVVASICSVAKVAAFIACGPNKFSIYDFGHLNAPVTLFPKLIGRYVAYAWHALLRTKRTKKSIDIELGNTFFISTCEIKKMLQPYGTTKNVFVDFVMNSLQYGYNYPQARIKNFIKKHPKLGKLFFNVLVFLRIEPDCYYILIKHEYHNKG